MNIKYIFLLSALLLGSSCTKENPIVTNEGEVLTTLNYILTPVNGGTEKKLSYKDLDGDGGNSPVITVDTLQVNTTYNAILELKNDQVSPSIDISSEIIEEGADHQFFFKTNPTDIVVKYNDVDANGKPLGIKTSLSTQSVSSGTITIILRHKPNKSASNVSNGDISNAGGETDIETTFPLIVK